MASTLCYFCDEAPGTSTTRFGHSICGECLEILNALQAPPIEIAAPKGPTTELTDTLDSIVGTIMEGYGMQIGGSHGKI